MAIIHYSYGCSTLLGRGSLKQQQRHDRKFTIKCCAVSATDDSSPVVRKARKRLVGSGARLIGCGSAVPKQIIHNNDLSTFLDTSDDWISARTGIRSRRVLSDNETLAGLAVESSRKALEMANVEPQDIDMIVLCSSTPEDLFGTAPQMQSEIGCPKAVAFDLTAACSGFILGLVTATRYIKGGGYRNILVVGADCLSKYVDWTDRGTCILFGDAAGAVVLQACAEDEDNLLGFEMRSDGNGQRFLHAQIQNVDGATHHNGAANVVTTPSKPSYGCLRMNGQEVFRFACRAVPQVVEAALEEACISSDKIDWLLLHQANQRILDAVSDRLHVSKERVISNLANYGNTSAASIPLALDEAVRSGKIKKGDVVASAGFGAGLTWASAIFKWG